MDLGSHSRPKVVPNSPPRGITPKNAKPSKTIVFTMFLKVWVCKIELECVSKARTFGGCISGSIWEPKSIQNELPNGAKIEATSIKNCLGID